ncbi:hypothetical protein DIC66_22255 [Rhodoferax lacus]|uniref:Aminoglycoside phosphotransferase domain-containing protein n=1 Tax=Rhodoferax lacus TaxID=2184758 RepID=A0A3E1R5N6_9BURK|nr:hypothetical protein [Rhodoferax lacus]RFO94666.1 hypothetical protein DIC66_22255 [Rhodoferax lacus]
MKAQARPLTIASPQGTCVADLEAKVNFLRAPSSYTIGDGKVTALETHMSWVFLVGQRVYKLKKPVCLPYLDFRSLQDRAFFCHEEVRLNARLAPGVYLGVVALQWYEGRFALVPEVELPAPGQTVDWLVLMRRLPAQYMLSQRISSSQLRPAAIDALVRVLGRFYREAPVISMTQNEYLDRFETQQLANRDLLLRPGFDLPDAECAITGLDHLGFKLAPMLGMRATQGQLVEGHGDLRPDHVCLMPRPLVIDCLEFNTKLRQLDPFHELALLGMECDLAGAPWVSRQLFSGLQQELGNPPSRELQAFYLAHQALLRARLAISHLQDPLPRTPHRWPLLAQRYVVQALHVVQNANACGAKSRG